jgi:hypothetical protein
MDWQGSSNFTYDVGDVLTGFELVSVEGGLVGRGIGSADDECVVAPGTTLRAILLRPNLVFTVFLSSFGTCVLSDRRIARISNFGKDCEETPRR